MPWHRFGDGFVWGHGGHWMALFALLIFLLLVGLLVWLIVAVVRSARRASGTPAAGSVPALPRGEDALEILRLRYARGEITRDEYRQMRDDLAR